MTSSTLKRGQLSPRSAVTDCAPARPSTSFRKVSLPMVTSGSIQMAKSTRGRVALAVPSSTAASRASRCSASSTPARGVPASSAMSLMETKMPSTLRASTPESGTPSRSSASTVSRRLPAVEPRTTSGLSSRILSRLGLTTSPTWGFVRAAAGKSQWLVTPTRFSSRPRAKTIPVRWGASVTMRSPRAGTCTVRPVSSTTARRSCAAVVAGNTNSAAAPNQSAVAFTSLRCGSTKKPQRSRREVEAAFATLSRAKSAPAPAQAGFLTDGSPIPKPRDGVSAACPCGPFPSRCVGTVVQEAQPITVAGPWRICTAFPALGRSSARSLRSRSSVVNARGLTPVAASARMSRIQEGATMRRIFGTVFFPLLLAAASALPVHGEPVQGEPAAGQAERAGEVTALLPVARLERSGAAPVALRMRDPVFWQDWVETEAQARARLQLLDGSILNVGSGARFQVVRHDQATEQTELTLKFGKVRAEVKKLGAGGRFEVRTETATVGVIGTHVYVAAVGALTTVINFDGLVGVNTAGAAAPERLEPFELAEVERGQPIRKRMATMEELLRALEDTPPR